MIAIQLKLPAEMVDALARAAAKEARAQFEAEPPRAALIRRYIAAGLKRAGVK